MACGGGKGGKSGSPHGSFPITMALRTGSLRDRIARTKVLCPDAEVIQKYLSTGSGDLLYDVFRRVLRDDTFAALVALARPTGAPTWQADDFFIENHDHGFIEYGHTSTSPCFSISPDNEDFAPLLAAVLWSSPCFVSLTVMLVSREGGINDGMLQLLLRAGRQTLGAISFVFADQGQRAAPLTEPVLCCLAECAALHSITAKNIYSIAVAETFCAQLTNHSPISLIRICLALDLFVAEEGGDVWSAPLPAMITELSLVNVSLPFAEAIFTAIPCYCRQLTALSIHGNRCRSPEHVSQLAVLLNSLPRLHSIRLSHMLIDGDCFVALCAAPALRSIMAVDIGSRFLYCPGEGVACEGLENAGSSAGLRRLAQFGYNYSLDYNIDNSCRLLVALLRAATLSRELSQLSISIHMSAFLDSNPALLPILHNCIAFAPIEILSIDTATAATLQITRDIVRILPAAAQTLRCLSLGTLRYDNACKHSIVSDLSLCSRLERLWWQAHLTDRRPNDNHLDEKGALLISTVCTTAPNLTHIGPLCLYRDGKATAAAMEKLHCYRESEATGPAWAVVRAGLERAQEEWLKGTTAGIDSPMFRLPASVLRRLGDYLEFTPRDLTLSWDRDEVVISAVQEPLMRAFLACSPESIHTL